jgi:UDP-N-acetyl-D-mannosaminuronic acid transferase (WecB/TagA/CpsF family)
MAHAIRSFQTPTPLVVTWLNHFSVLHADWEALRYADLIGVDGTFLQFLLRLSGVKIGRTSADLVLPNYLPAGGRVVLIGGRPGVAAEAARRIPQAVGSFDGFSQLEALLQNTAPLLALNPETVILGLGAGLQDRVAATLKSQLPHAVIFTAGGWLDQLVHCRQYFPPIAHTLRLGWLLRLAREPRRLAKRYTVDVARAAFSLPHIRKNIRSLELPRADLHRNPLH